MIEDPLMTLTFAEGNLQLQADIYEFIELGHRKGGLCLVEVVSLLSTESRTSQPERSVSPQCPLVATAMPIQ